MTDPNAIRTSLYAAVGAGDTVVQAVADLVAQVRERADRPQFDVAETVETARDRISGLPADLAETVESLRERLAGLPAELPEEIAELRERFSSEELMKVAEAYLKVASDLYTALAERGEGTVERLRSQPAVGEGIDRAEELFGDAVELTEEALGTVARQTRAVGEQAAKFAGLAAGRISDTAEGVGEAIADAGDEAALRVLELGDQAEEAGSDAAERVESARTGVRETADDLTERVETVVEPTAPVTVPAETEKPESQKSDGAEKVAATPTKVVAKNPAKTVAKTPAKAPAKKAAKAPAKKAAPRKTSGS